jgi:bla regulator protein blaR1
MREIALSIAMATLTLAQTPNSEKRVEFAVASIKPSDPSHVGAQTFFMPGGQFIAMTAPLKSLVCFAYQLREHQVAGGPPWFDSDPFDISAKADYQADNNDLRTMVRALLSDRFQLRFHHEMKDQPVYALVLGKNGAKLKAAEKAGFGVGAGVPGRLNGIGADIPTLASVLADRLGRNVVDQTGLKGFYNFLLTWSPDELQPENQGPTLFTAIQEQLGLKLESTKGLVDVLVVDHAERPSAN